MKWGKFIALQKQEGQEIVVRAGKYINHSGIPVAFGKDNDGFLVGAGEFNKTATVTGWESQGYSMRTPMKLRPAIQEAFLAHKDLIEKDIA